MKAADGHTQRGSFTLQAQVIRRARSCSPPLLAAALAAPAAAHVQVRPALAAPGDPVLFQVHRPGRARRAAPSRSRCRSPRTCCRSRSRTRPAGSARSRTRPTGASTRSRWRGRAGRGRLRPLRVPGLHARAGGRASSGSRLQTYDDGTVVALDRRARLRQPGRGDDGQRLGAARERGRRERGGRERRRRRPRRARPPPPTAGRRDRRPRTTTARCR